MIGGFRSWRKSGAVSLVSAKRCGKRTVPVARACGSPYGRRMTRQDSGRSVESQSLELALGLLRSQETGLPVDFQEKASS